MKYWLIDGGEAKGPYEPDELKKVPGFGPSSMIAPDGADRADDWKPASYYLLKPPNPRSEPVERPRASPAPVVSVEPEVVPAPAAAAPATGGVSARSPLVPLLLGTAALAAVGGGAYYMRKQKLKQEPPPVEQAAAVAPVAPVPQAPIAKAPPEGARGDSLPLVDDATRTDALSLVQNFTIVSPAGKYPSGPFDVLNQRRWKSPKTLGELYEMRPYEALAIDALEQAQSRGETIAHAEKEIRKDPAAWKAYAGHFLKTAGQASWDVEPGKGDTVRVVAHLRSPRTGAPERRAFDADLKRRTLKPADFESWRDLDAKNYANWSRQHLKIGEDAGEAAVAQAAPVYPWTRSKPFKQRKQAPGTKPKPPEPVPDESEAPDETAPQEQPVAQKPAPPPQDADEFDPLSGTQEQPPDHSAPAPQAVESKPPPAPARKKAAEPPPSSVPDSISAAPPKSAPPQPDSVPPLSDNNNLAPPSGGSPSGSPGSAPSTSDKAEGLKTSPGAKKSVTDMSVDELEKYLNRK